MSSHSSETRVYQLLNRIYETVTTLEEAVRTLDVTGQLGDTLLQSGDKDSYVRFLKTTLVATMSGARPPPPHLYDSPYTELRDLIVSVMETVHKRNIFPLRNALTLGFRELSDEPRAQRRFFTTVEMTFPSHNLSMFYNSEWRTLLERIGNKRMTYLLVHRSFFLAVVASTTSNYMQVAGVLIHELSPFKNKTAAVLHPDGQAQRKRVHRSRMVIEQPKAVNIAVNETSSDITTHHPVRGDDNDIVTSDNSAVNENNAINDNIETSNTLLLTKESIVMNNYDVANDGHTNDNKVSFHRLVTFDAVATDSMSTDDVSVTELTPGGSRVISALTHNVRPMPQRPRKRTVDVLEDAETRVESGSVHEKEDGGESTHRKRKRRRRGNACGNESGMAYNYHIAFDRRGILYARNLREQIPRNNFLSNVKTDEEGVVSLLDRVFVVTDVGATITPEPTGGIPICVDWSACTRNQDLADVYKTLSPHFKLLIDNHKRCKYGQLLHQFVRTARPQQPHVAKTTVSSQVATATTSKTSLTDSHVPESLASRDGCASKTTAKDSLSHAPDTENIATLLELCTLPRQIYLFLREVCRIVIPPALWGSARNKELFLANIRLFIELGRYESMTLGQLMRTIKVNEYACLASVHSHLRRQELVAKLLSWVLSDYIMLILKSFFYITDCALGKNRVLYYHKSVWKNIRQEALSASLGKGMMTRIDSGIAKSLLASGDSLGVSCLRFLPKASTVRSILNLSQRPHPGSVKKKTSINSQLKDLLHVLRYELFEDPTLIGSSVFGMQDIFNKWKAFVQHRRSSSDSRWLNCVKVDIKTCFDIVDPHLVFRIISDIINKRTSRYVIRSYVAITDAGGKPKRTFHTEVTTENEFDANFLLAMTLGSELSRKNIHDAILVDLVRFRFCEREDLIKTLKAHLFGNIVKFDGAYYCQTRGISQGSVVSTMLNNCYFGHLEKHRLPAPQSDELLMRHTDDFLFVTPYLDRANAFLDELVPGIPEYNCHVNEEKTLCNFNHGSTNTVHHTAPFPWCGLLIDPCSLEIRPDYSRYLGRPTTDSITTELSRCPGTALKDKLVYCMRNKCHAIFLDPRINSSHVIRTNIYDVFLHMAIMFQCIVRRFPSNQRVHRNTAFFFGVVQQLSRFLVGRCRTVTKMSEVRDVFGKPIIDWLCCAAFQQNLQRRQSAYRPMLKLLRRWRRMLEKRMDITLKSRLLDVTRNAGIPEELILLLE